MTTEERPEPKRRPGSAARLLSAIGTTSPEAIEALAQALGVELADLLECGAGVRVMSLELQVQLAAAVAELVPEHARPARRLHAQAQAALRMEAALTERHLTYPKEHFR